MSVIRVEGYTMKNSEKVLKVILKPTKKFPEGTIFLVDDNEIVRTLLAKYTWTCCQRDYYIFLEANPSVHCRLKFHREYVKELLGYYPEYVAHQDNDYFNICKNNLIIGGDNGEFQLLDSLLNPELIRGSL